MFVAVVHLGMKVERLAVCIQLACACRLEPLRLRMDEAAMISPSLEIVPSIRQWTSMPLRCVYVQLATNLVPSCSTKTKIPCFSFSHHLPAIKGYSPTIRHFVARRSVTLTLTVSPRFTTTEFWSS